MIDRIDRRRKQVFKKPWYVRFQEWSDRNLGVISFILAVINFTLMCLIIW